MAGVGINGSLGQDSAIEPDFTWMLKCPFHLPYLRELFNAFPDATVVWTHRDPVECIASACSLYETLMDMAAETYSIDKRAIGKAVLDYTRDSLEMAENTLKSLLHNNKGDNKVIHIRYQDTVKKPTEVCKDVFTQAWDLGASGSSDASDAMSKEYNQKLGDYLAENKAKREREKSRKGQTGQPKVMHSYSLEEYGLTTDQVRAEFKWYTDKYNL